VCKTALLALFLVGCGSPFSSGLEPAQDASTGEDAGQVDPPPENDSGGNVEAATGDPDGGTEDAGKDDSGEDSGKSVDSGNTVDSSATGTECDPSNPCPMGYGCQYLDAGAQPCSATDPCGVGYSCVFVGGVGTCTPLSPPASDAGTCEPL